MRFQPSSSCSLLARVLVYFGLVLVGGAVAVPMMAQGVVISQVFGGNSATGPYNEDYVELFNPTAAAVSLNGWGVQYASAAGTSYSVAFLPNASIAAGGYFLVGLASSTGGTSLPAADFTFAGINLSGTAGKVYLTNTVTSLTASVVNGCPVSSAVVDYVGYGATATCFRGSGPAPVITSSQAEVKSSVCAAAAANATDFVAGTPVPHNSSSVPGCGGATALSATGMATPSSVTQGSPVLLTVRPIAATNPASTGLTVSANLGAEGGSTTQPLNDDGTNGDVTAGDGTYSYLLTVPASVAAGATSVVATVTDAQARSAMAVIGVTVMVPAPVVTVRGIQAAKPSPYAGQVVTTTGVVTSVKTSGFYLEAQDADMAPVTPEGVLVYTGSAPPSTVVVGELLQVTGTVNTYPTTGPTPGTEIDTPTNYTVVQSGVALPAAIPIGLAMDSAAGGIRQFSKYEGMRVAIGSLTTTSGTGGSLNETTEMNTSTGQFYGVVTGVARPFREPGISVLEPALPAGVTVCPLGAVPASCVPQWDGNPELIEVDSKTTGGGALDVTTGTVLTGVAGVMDFSTGGPLVVMDRAMRPTVTGGLAVVPVPAKAATEFTVASFNMERFYSSDPAAAHNPGSSVVTVTAEAYARRLAKGSLAIRTVLNMPDVIGVQEIENLQVLTDLANQINTDAAAAAPGYVATLFLATDGTGINTGLLVKSSTVDTVSTLQSGLTTTFTNSTGAQATLNDRTPLVAHLGIKRAGMADYPVTVIVVHQRSLISVDDTTSTGATVRLKREAQAEFLAKLIQGYQAAGEHVVSVGDYNAFQFSDGYVDTMGVTVGTPVPAAQVVTPPVAGLASPALVDLVTLLPAVKQQSYVEDGDAQVLDHVVVTQDLAKLETRMVYAHIDSDWPLVNLNNATLPTRVSDHDPAVAYFSIPAPVVGVSASTLAFGSQLVTTSAAKLVTVTNTGNDVLAVTSVGVTGAGYAETNTCGTAVAAGASCVVTLTFAPTATGTANGTVTIVSSAATTPTVVTLAGSGGDLTLAAAGASSMTVTSGQTATFMFTATSVGGYAGAVTYGCSGAGMGEVCAVTPGSGTLAAGGTVTVTAAVSTTSRTIPAVRGSRPVAGLRPGSGLGSGLGLGGVALAGLLGCFGLRRIRGVGVGRLLLVWMAVMVVGTMAGCSGSGTKPNPAGTPAGMQTITLTATSGGVTRTTTAVVTVQ